MLREWTARLRDWFRRDELDRELKDELGFHRAQLESAATAGGADAEEAGFAARRRLGQVTRYQDESRDRWSWPWLDHFQKDVRYALRGLRRSPGLTTTVVLTLGLGIGANAAMFGVIDRLMFRPVPYLRDPGQVHRVHLRSTDRGRDQTWSSYTYTTFLDLKRWTTSFTQYAGLSQGSMAVGVGDASRERQVARVSATYFDFFDAAPALGRYFDVAEDSTPSGAPVVVLSYTFWQSEFAGRNVLGETLQVGNVSSTVIGVAPRGFTGVEAQPAELFMPITTYAYAAGGPDDRNTYFTQYHWGWMRFMVRRKPGVSVAAATADLSTAHVRSWSAARTLDPELTPAEIARPRAMAGPLKVAAGPEASLEAKTLLWVMGVAIIVLLIASANVTNLMLARVLRRRRETAVRLALGVSRRRLLAQSFTESLVLASLGCVAGVVVAQWSGGLLRNLFLPAGATFNVLSDWRTLAAASTIALVAGVLTALGPALLSTRGELAATLKAGARDGGVHRSRMRSTLLVLQGAMSVLLLVGAGLFVRRMSHVEAMRLGYDADPVLMATRNLRGMELSDSERVLLGRRLLRVAEATPGVEHASWVSSIPFWSTSNVDLYVPGIDSVGRLGRFSYQTATPGYFTTIGTRILQGRPFTAADRGGTVPVTVVSESMASVLWPGKNALGACVKIGSDTMPCTTVIGVAENAIQNSLTDDQHLRYYLPLEQFRPARGFALLLRVRGEPSEQAERVRSALQSVMPGQAYITVRPFSELLDAQRKSWRLGATMFVAFGVLALIVAAIGLYGVIAYSVAQRMHELGIRIALGAQSSDVVWLVVGQSVRFAILGVATGLAAALLLARWMQPLLFEQSAKDPVVYGGVAGLLLLVASLASALPARRATRADPNTALRSD